MRIAVISPYAEHNGKTTVSMLLGMELAKSNKTTCMCHTKPISESVYDYLGINAFTDKTSTPSQIVKILKEGNMDQESISSYCKDITPNFEVFANNATNFNRDDMQYMINYIVRDFPHEHVIVDIDNEDWEFNKKIISLCDVVVMCITQDVVEAKKFKQHKEEFVELVGEKPLVVVVNKYNSSKSTLQELAKWMGLKQPNNWLVLHENPWVCWATNHGKLLNMYKLVSKKDTRVFELQGELNKIILMIIKAKTLVDKKKGGRR